MKILITGTAGFIGFHVAEKLAAEKHTIIGIDSINNYYDVTLKSNRLAEAGFDANLIAYNSKVQSTKHSNYSFVQLQLEDAASLQLLFSIEKFDIVINLAAQAGVRYSLTHPAAYINSNITGFANLIECCRHFNIKHLVFASSSSVYGLNEKIPFATNDATNHPASLYAATKKSNELMAHVYSHLFKIPTTGLRFFTVYGPWGRPDMAPFLFTEAILHNKPIKVFNNGNMMRDFTFIDDVVEVIAKVIHKPPSENKDWNAQLPDASSSSAPYKIYNIGNNQPAALTEFIQCIENAIGKKANKELMPLQPGDVPTTFADVSDLEKDFNYKPYTPLQEGINTFVNWYKTYYKL
ncbi:MAG: NAD-dependent epimerase [Chitinophagaceae bacterium]|nr:NAD-dependent epimerase [Chitinophagaceae bacterium]MCW5905700.1 NAD-dependent epimerase [Chitinophagaceae bacterium]